jgi:uncharacterized protein
MPEATHWLGSGVDDLTASHTEYTMDDARLTAAREPQVAPGPRPPAPVIAALQLPPFGHAARPMAWYEDYLVTNARIFASAGITALKIQDETRQAADALPRTVARMSALVRVLRAEIPGLRLGIIVQAHDAVAPLAIADAVGAEFVRLKVFVGAAVNAEGVRQALSPVAMEYRAAIDRPDIAIYSDVHDRTAVPAAPVPHEMAAAWAQNMGANALVITGADFADTLARIAAARGNGVICPVLIGGGVTEVNVEAALGAADSVIVSTALLRKGAGPEDLARWDAGLTERFVVAARRARKDL